MNTLEILATIDAELARLEQVRVLLTENPPRSSEESRVEKGAVPSAGR
jgi:hypothetical protein